MKIFSVDSAAAAGSAALLEDERLLAESFRNEGLTHSQTLMLRCDEVFRQTGVRPAEVDLFAVTAGPGSFTGLRIGIGTVKGMAFALCKPCCAVSSFAALAEAAREQSGEILAVLDARQKRVYCEGFRVENGQLCPALPKQILPIAELLAALSAAGLQYPLVVGDAAEAVCGALGGRAETDARFFQIHAAAVGAVAARMAAAGETCSADALRPSYLQLSQAERARQSGELSL